MAKSTNTVYFNDLQVAAERFTSTFDSREMVKITLDGDDNFMSLENATKLFNSLEKAVVDKEYWYENMQAENDRLNQRVEDLEETLDNIGYSEAV